MNKDLCVSCLFMVRAIHGNTEIRFCQNFDKELKYKVDMCNAHISKEDLKIEQMREIAWTFNSKKRGIGFKPPEERGNYA